MLVPGNVSHPFSIDRQPNEKVASEIRRALHDQSRGLPAWSRRGRGRRTRFGVLDRAKYKQPGTKRNPDGNVDPIHSRLAFSLNASTSQRLNSSPPTGSRLAAKPSMRVLIADDQRSVGTSLADLVRHCNHEIVAVVGSGVEAIQAYSLHHPDVVLMDYWMPKLNGATACRNIVAKDPTARVILVSGWSPANGIVSDSGALTLLPKPVDLDDLATALNTVAQNLSFQSTATIS